MKNTIKKNKKVPPTFRQSVKRARDFYRQYGADVLCEHCLTVLDTARKVGLVEPWYINKPHRDMKMAWTNNLLTELILYHVVEPSRFGLTNIKLPKALERDDIRRELDVFCKLMALDRKGAPLSDYLILLNNGDAPLALPVMIVDSAVTHRTEDRTIDFLAPPNDAALIFRYYSSMEDADNALRNNANAGERIYAPLAEMFGYPSLAGDIIEHAYCINHPVIYNAVKGQLADEIIKQRISFTQSIVKKVVDGIYNSLSALGVEGAVTPRMNKHPGKIMRKVYRYLTDGTIKTHDITNFSDLVALRVVVDKFKGKKIDRMNDGKKDDVIKTVIDIVEACIKAVLLAYDVVNPHITTEAKSNANGYRAYHISTETQDDDRLVKFEAQVKTTEWHEIAESGGAAHYLYLGGDEEFTKTIKNAYKEFIHTLNEKHEKN